MTMIVPTAVTATAITTTTQTSEVWEKKKKTKTLHSRRRPPPLRASVAASFDDHRRKSHDQRKQLTTSQPPWHRNLLSIPTTTKSTATALLAPVAVVSGTASVYAAVVRHPSSTLTPLSVVYMLLLALQYAVQPRLAKRFIPSQHSSARVALAEESVKTVLAVGIVAVRVLRTSTSSSVLHHPLVSSWTWQSSLAIAGLPAILYALQGVLQYRAYQSLDAVTYNGLSQGKTLSAALACWLLLGTRQSPLQLLSLGLLLTATLLFQRGSNSNSTSSPGASSSSSVVSPAPTSSSTTYTNKKDTATSNRLRYRNGILPCVAATIVSGVAGALSQHGLQSRLLHHRRDPYVFTVEVSLYSALVLGLSRLWTTTTTTTRAAKEPSSPQSGGWTWQVWIPIVSKACGGILTALVHQTAGTVQKGFALVLGLVLARLWQQQQSTADAAAGGHTTTVATLLVLVSSWLHFTNPPAM